MGFRKSRNEAPQAVCCNCGLQTDQKTVEERSADSLERQAQYGNMMREWYPHGRIVTQGQCEDVRYSGV